MKIGDVLFIYSTVFTMQGHAYVLCVMNGENAWIAKPMGTEVHVSLRIKRGGKYTDPQLGRRLPCGSVLCTVTATLERSPYFC
jgi:hypothetical protein